MNPQWSGRLLALSMVWTASVGPASAEITRIVIDRRVSESPTFEGRAIADRGQYERLIGRAYGELDPRDRRNALIQDIDRAPRNARGRVAYVATFSLMKPIDLSRTSGLLFYEAVNRSNELIGRMIGAGSEGATSFLRNAARSFYAADGRPTFRQRIRGPGVARPTASRCRPQSIRMEARSPDRCWSSSST